MCGEACVEVEPLRGIVTAAACLGGITVAVERDARRVGIAAGNMRQADSHTLEREECIRRHDFCPRCAACDLIGKVIVPWADVGLPRAGALHHREDDRKPREVFLPYRQPSDLHIVYHIAGMDKDIRTNPPDERVEIRYLRARRVADVQQRRHTVTSLIIRFRYADVPPGLP